MGDSSIPGSLRAQSAPPAEIVADYARTCVGYVEKAVGVRLDFTTDTLPVLDHYLREAGKSAAARSDALQLVVTVAGCYLGELVRQVHGLVWEQPGDDPVQWHLRSPDGDLSIYPVAITHVAVHGARAERGLQLLELSSADRAEVQRRLDALPQVDEDQYVAASTRIEVLEIALDVIKGRRHASQGHDHGDD